MTRSNKSGSGITGQQGLRKREGSIVTDTSGNPDLVAADLGDNSEESEDDECPVLPRPSVPDSELSPLYWFLLKVVKYIKFGSPTATLLALCGLSRYDLSQTLCQQALDVSQAMDVLVNVLEADDHKCKVAALRVLQKMVQIPYFQRLLVFKSGIETVVNLLSEPEQDVRCLAAVTLAHAVNNHRSRMLTRKAGAVPLLVDLLDIHGSLQMPYADDLALKGDTRQKIQAATAAAKALRSLSFSNAARQEMYLAGGIPLLTRLTLSIGNIPKDQLAIINPSGQQHVRHGSITSVTALSKVMPIGAKPRSILVNKRPTTSLHPADTMLDYELVTAVTGVIHQCAADEMFRASVKADILLSQLLKNMRYECETLQMLCASTIAHFAEEENNRKVLTRLKAPETLVWVLKQSELAQQQQNQQQQQQSAGNVTIAAPTILTTTQFHDDSFSDQQSIQLRVQDEKTNQPSVNIPLLKAVSTAVWKLSSSPEACDRFRQLGVVQIFIRQLNQSTEEVQNTYYLIVLTYPLSCDFSQVLLPVVSSISVIGTDAESLSTLQSENAVPRFVWLLSCNHPGLLSAAALTMANLTADQHALRMLESIDAARLLWSLLKHPSPVVQAAAASAIAAFSERSRRSGEVARSLVGGLELLVSLLRAPNLNVVTAAASAVARMATENETLAVLSDHHVVTLLASLVRSKNRHLKLRVAEAIAECCRWPGNPAQLGQGGGVKPLIGYLRSKHLGLRRAAARALHQVSTDINNCITLHKHGAVMLLLKLVGCGDAEIQAAAAGCLSNIRSYILTQ